MIKAACKAIFMLVGSELKVLFNACRVSFFWKWSIVLLLFRRLFLGYPFCSRFSAKERTEDITYKYSVPNHKNESKPDCQDRL